MYRSYMYSSGQKYGDVSVPFHAGESRETVASIGSESRDTVASIGGDSRETAAQSAARVDNLDKDDINFEALAKK